MCIENTQFKSWKLIRLHPSVLPRCKAIPKLQLIYKYFLNKFNLIFLLHEYLLSNTCKMYLRDLIASHQLGLARESRKNASSLNNIAYVVEQHAWIFCWTKQTAHARNNWAFRPVFIDCNATIWLVEWVLIRWS